MAADIRLTPCLPEFLCGIGLTLGGGGHEPLAQLGDTGTAGRDAGVLRNDVWLLAGCAAGVLLVLALVWRPLLFAVLVGVATGLAVPTVGALLVLSLLITPGAAAARVTANPFTALLLATLFAEVAVLGGIVASLAPGAPISGYVTAIAFAIYLACRALGAARPRRIGRSHPTPAAAAAP